MSGPPRVPPYDVQARLGDPLAALAMALGHWEHRDETSPPVARMSRLAAEALAVMDDMIRELQLMRARLAAELRTYDTAPAGAQRKDDHG